MNTFSILLTCISSISAPAQAESASVIGTWQSSPPPSSGATVSPLHWGSEGVANDNVTRAAFPTPSDLAYRVYAACTDDTHSLSAYNLDRPPSSKESNYLLCYLDFLDLLHHVHRTSGGILWDAPDDALLWDAASCRRSSLRLWAMALLYTKDRHNLILLDQMAQLEQHEATSRLMREELSYIVNQEADYLPIIAAGIPPAAPYAAYRQRINPEGRIYFDKKFAPSQWQAPLPPSPPTAAPSSQRPAATLAEVTFLDELTQQIAHLLTQKGSFETGAQKLEERSQRENFLLCYADFLDLFNTPDGAARRDDAFLWQALTSNDTALREWSVLLLLLKDRNNMKLIALLSQYEQQTARRDHMRRYLSDIISEPNHHFRGVLRHIAQLKHPHFHKYHQLSLRYAIPGASYQRNTSQ